MKPRPTRPSHSDNPQKALQNNSEFAKPISRTIEHSGNSGGRIFSHQEGICHFCEVFQRVTAANTKVIEFKQLLLLLVHQGLSVVDIFNLLSTNKALSEEIQYVKNWQHTWTTLDDKEIFELVDAFIDGMRLDSFLQNPGCFRFSLKTCYIGMNSGNLQERIDNAIQFFTNPTNSIYLRNCTLFEIYLSQETLDPNNNIWEFAKENNVRLALRLELNPNEVKAFDPVFSLIERLDPKILENVYSFYLGVVVGNKNLEKVRQLSEQLKKCKNLRFFQCGGIGTNTIFAPSSLSVSSFKCLGDITKKANLQLNLTHLTHFECLDIKDEASLKLENLHHFVCWDIFHSNFEFMGYKFISTIKCKQIKASGSVLLENLPNLISFKCGDINGLLKFGRNLNKLESIKVGNLTLYNHQQGRLLLLRDLPGLTVFECGDVEGTIDFSGEASNLNLVKCGSLRRKEIKASKPKPIKSRTQVIQHYPENRVFSGKLCLPRELPNLTSLHFNDIEIDDNFDLPNTPKLEKISFGKVRNRSIATDLTKLQKSLINMGRVEDKALTNQKG